MARAFREIRGNITKLNPPHFASERNLWVMMVKENDQWIGLCSRNEEKIKAYHRQLETQQTAQNLNLTVQATTLTQEKVKMAEYAFGIRGVDKIRFEGEGRGQWHLNFMLPAT